MKREFVKLGEICSIQSGGTPNRSCQEYWANGDVPWVKIGDLSEKFVTKTEECITHSGLTHSSAKLFPPGTILYSIFATLGAVSILKIEATTNQAIAGIQITSEKVDRGYLFYYLSSLRNKVERSGRGVAQSNLTLTFLKEIQVPCPSLSEQRHIADMLDKVDTLISNYQRQLNLIKELQESYFDEQFGEGCSYSRELLEQNVEEMFIGPFGSAPKNEAFVSAQDGFCMVYEQKHAIRGTMEVETRYVNKAKHDALKRFEVHGGDIIVSCRGTIGKTFVVPSSAPMGIMHPSIMKIRLRKDRYNPMFFERLLRRYFAREEAKANGSGVKMAVTATTLGKESFIRPPLSEQLRFVSFIEQMDKTRQSLTEAMQTAKTLQAALEQRYFNTEEKVND